MSNSQELISAIYATQLEIDEPNNFSFSPNFIHELTYDAIDKKTGKKKVMRLSVYAKELYRIIRMTTGENGVSWRSAENYAELCNMSEGKVHDAKQELTQAFHQLNGKPLIVIEEKRRSNYKAGKCVGKSPSHLISVTHIWGHARSHATLKKLQKYEAGSQYDRACEAGSQYDRAPGEAGSPHDPNNINNNNISLSKEQQPTAGADSVVFLDKSKGLSPSDPKSRALNFLLQNNFTKSTAKNLVQKYSVDDISSASHYMAKQVAKKKRKGEVIDNLQGYFTEILKHRYWEKK